MKKWILPLALLALVFAALPVLALSGGYGYPFGQSAPTQPPVRSDEGIAPDECSQVHNPGACEPQDRSPDTPVSSDDPASDSTPPPPGPGAGVDDGQARSLAPIEGLEVQVLESFPVQYVARVDYGLPNGCARPGDYRVERNGTRIEINVWILLPSDPNTVCTMIYGIGHHSIPLGSDFVSGQTYTLIVNGTTSTTFTAQ